MNEAFANLYEFFVADPKFSNILFRGQDYLWIGLSFLTLVVIGLFLFYRAIDPNPVYRWKWFFYLVILTTLIAGVWSFFWLKTYALPVQFANEEEGVTKFALNITLWTAIFTFGLVILLSFPFKYLSINNFKNPF